MALGWDCQAKTLGLLAGRRSRPQSTGAGVLGRIRPAPVHAIPNFKFLYLNKNSKNRYEFPKFVENRRNIKKYKIIFWNPLEPIYVISLTSSSFAQ
jgi:hypothetical protein